MMGLSVFTGWIPPAEFRPPAGKKPEEIYASHDEVEIATERFDFLMGHVECQQPECLNCKKRRDVLSILIDDIAYQVNYPEQSLEWKREHGKAECGNE
jgi:hypothetical protein